MAAHDEDPVKPFASAAKWAAWLDGQHAKANGIWIKIAKKDSGIATVTHAEALDIAIQYGWIDATRRKFDDDHFLQRFCPRRPRSKWSKINRDKATALIEGGEMKPSGMREVEAAKQDGRWEAAYDGQKTIQVPPDLQKQLDRSAKARKAFEDLDSRNRYAILFRLHDAKKPETRERRLKQFVAMLKKGEKLHP